MFGADFHMATYRHILRDIKKGHKKVLLSTVVKVPEIVRWVTKAYFPKWYTIRVCFDKVNLIATLIQKFKSKESN